MRASESKDMFGFETPTESKPAKQRQRVLAAIREQSTPVSLSDVASTVERRRTGIATEDASQTLQCRLHHVHLPKLDAWDEIEYDSSNRLVR